jgi:D-glycero-D-manno-heptose 1,7-bisphosphate phosphatase
MSGVKAFFLDRDGVINHDFGYVSTVENFKFIDGIFDMLHRIQVNNYLIFIITNQSGIGRGFFSEDDYLKLTDWMIDEFKKEYIYIEKVLYCPHSPDINCQCRKPKCGLIDSLLAYYPLNLKESWMVGDKESDIELAVNCGILNTIFVQKGLINHNLSFNPKFTLNSLSQFSNIII